MRIAGPSHTVAKLLALLVCGHALHAQSALAATQARAIQMPDTLGANFAISDSAQATSGPDDLDFLVGMWHFRFQQRNGDGNFNPPYEGHWFFERLAANGAMVVDHWRRDNPESTMASGTWTYRTFNPQRNVWMLQGVNTSSGSWLPGSMWSDGTDRFVIQHYSGVIVRFRYFAIEPNRFLWRADASTDQGTTWLLDRWTMEVTRVGR